MLNIQQFQYHSILVSCTLAEVRRKDNVTDLLKGQDDLLVGTLFFSETGRFVPEISDQNIRELLVY
jgi:pSer/pThr/pTyr-binding forkhead associated (FHA) protein